MSEQKPWGPENPHPLSRMRTELVWEGKYDEYGRRREVQLPSFPLVLQKVETIDEPRDRERAEQGKLFDEGAFKESAHRDDFRNRLIWGDNKLALTALLSDFRGKLDLIYVDPPFDVGADFTMTVSIGDDQEPQFKDQSLLEAVAYRDMWGRGNDSYLHTMAERIVLMKQLLKPEGSLFVHCDWHVSHFIKLLLSDIFSPSNFVNEIIWYYYNKMQGNINKFPANHDVVLWYSNTAKTKFKALTEERDTPVNQLKRVWDKEKNAIVNAKDSNGNVIYQESTTRRIDDVWRIPMLQPSDKSQNVGYATQKPEELLRRIIEAVTEEGDIVADFFCGSGTTLAMAEKLGRRWIGSDLGRYAIHTTRKRLIGVQRELHKANKPYRSFDVYNLGRYERQWWQAERLRGANEEHRTTVLKFFRASAISNPPSGLIHGTKGGAYVHVDNIDSIFTISELREVAQSIASVEGIEDWQNHGSVLGSRAKPKLIVLAWEFEMDLRRRVEGVEGETGVEITLKYIPREIMEPNRDTVQFFDAAALDAEAVIKEVDGKKQIDVKLTNFYPALTEVPDKELEALKERAVKSPFDFIDFWAIDFEYREDKPFEHHWQDYRTRKDRSLKTCSDLGWEYESKGVKRICVKVIDVFGIDTTKVIEVKV
ncbi:MAG: site-specific DNA-methyltransferase [Fimbriimonadaceae bacterium]|nr:MAG: site-specific DNA-methyltransferase [Fimbriimonadaceae bacterium]